jgi:hypothetical protein
MLPALFALFPGPAKKRERYNTATEIHELLIEYTNEAFRQRMNIHVDPIQPISLIQLHPPL